MIGAAVDVGSNSVHLLVAKVAEQGLESMIDESELIGLGDVVDATGQIPPDSIEVLVHALTVYLDKARDAGATSVTFLATEPLRRATNGRQVAQAVAERTGHPLTIIGRDEEGELTFLGVTGGRRVDESMLVADIGGGSTEVMLFDPGAGLSVTGLAVGSARLWREHVTNDPPTRDEIAALRADALRAVDALPRQTPARAVFVGGTATNIVKLAPLRLSSFDEMYETIAEAPAAALAERFRFRLRRAHQLAPGAAIAEALLRRYGVDTAEVSDASLRDGAILHAAGHTLVVS